jgi:hypothetical protein
MSDAGEIIKSGAAGRQDPAFRSRMETFERLGLIRREYDLRESSSASYARSMRDMARQQGAFLPPYLAETAERPPALTYEFQFTEYGVEFMKACHGPVQTEQQRS